MIEVETSNDKLRAKIQYLEETFSRNSCKIVELEMENSRLENENRIHSSTIDELKKKLDSTLEDLIIKKTDVEYIKEFYEEEMKRARQQQQHERNSIASLTTKLSQNNIGSEKGKVQQKVSEGDILAMNLDKVSTKKRYSAFLRPYTNGQGANGEETELASLSTRKKYNLTFISGCDTAERFADT